MKTCFFTGHFLITFLFPVFLSAINMNSVKLSFIFCANLIRKLNEQDLKFLFINQIVTGREPEIFIYFQTDQKVGFRSAAK